MQHAIDTSIGVPWVVTDSSGWVTAASPGVGRLFNLTPRGLVGRNIYLFFDRDRGELARVAGSAASGVVIDLSVHLRPRDRKPLDVPIRIERVTDDLIPDLRWTFGGDGTSAMESDGDVDHPNRRLVRRGPHPSR